MLQIEADDTVFNYRVAGVALFDGKVLLHRMEGHNHWSLPGGRGEMMEPSGDTLRREMREELFESVVVGRALWTVENFFMDIGRRYHEICFVFLMEFEKDSSLFLKEGEFPGAEGLVFRWVPLSELNDFPLQPTFLRKGLQDLPSGTVHLVHVDG